MIALSVVQMPEDQTPPFTSTVVEAWARSPIIGLDIIGSLYGKSHHFLYSGMRCSIIFPVVEFDDNLNPISRGDRFAKKTSWNSRNPTLDTTLYQLKAIEVTIDTDRTLEIPTPMLETSPKRPDLSGRELEQKLNEISCEYEYLLGEVVSYWKDIVRWVTGSSGLDSHNILPARYDASHLDYTSLRSKATEHRFWMPTHGMVLHRNTEVNLEAWESINTALVSELVQPLWWLYIHEAQHRLSGQDYNGAVLSAAIALESIIRSCEPPACERLAEQGITRKANDKEPISAILKRWLSCKLGTIDIASYNSAMDLVTKRNKIMHEGNFSARFDRAQVTEIISTVRDFIDSADQWYFIATGKYNPRRLRKRISY
jgi:hypothetical protein